MNYKNMKFQTRKGIVVTLLCVGLFIFIFPPHSSISGYKRFYYSRGKWENGKKVDVYNDAPEYTTVGYERSSFPKPRWELHHTQDEGYFYTPRIDVKNLTIIEVIILSCSFIFWISTAPAPNKTDD